MAIRMDPQRRRLSVSQSDPAGVAKARNAGVSLQQRLDESGLTTTFDAARKQGRRVASITSVTDEDLKRRTSFTEKDVEVLAPEGDDESQLMKWVMAQGVAWSCRKGLKPESPNQDSFSILVVEGDFALYCVYDGHGPLGHDVSDVAREKLVKMFLASERRVSDPKRAFEETFMGCQKEVEEMASLDASLSGTTCTMAYQDYKTDHVWIAHVGDSRAVLGKKDKEAISAEELTVDHKPNLEVEKRRIESSNPPGRVVFDGFYNHRVFALNGMYPGLNMSRAIGDEIGHKEAGLTAMPDVRFIDLAKLRAANPGAALTLILCTDGVWEFIESDEAVRLTLSSENNNIKDATDKLAKESWDRWMQDSDNEISDDITAIVVHLPKP